MIWLSLHSSPAGETSAFNKMRAFKSRRAGLFPFRIKPSSRSRSSALSRTTYLFTDFSRVAIVPSVARIVTEANHQILSNWLKRATSLSGQARGLGGIGDRPDTEVMRHSQKDSVPRHPWQAHRAAGEHPKQKG